MFVRVSPSPLLYLSPPLLFVSVLDLDFCFGSGVSGFLTQSVIWIGHCSVSGSDCYHCEGICHSVEFVVLIVGLISSFDSEIL